MSKAYLFAMFLSFTGCIGGDDLEELPTEEDEIIEPVGWRLIHSIRNW